MKEAYLVTFLIFISIMAFCTIMMWGNIYAHGYTYGFNDGVNYTKEKLRPSLENLNLSLTQLNNMLNMSFEFVIV